MPTEGIFTPHVHDRVIGLENVDYVFNDGARPRRGDRVQAGRDHPDARARGARRRARAAASGSPRSGCSRRSSEGVFGDVSRRVDEGRGIEGIVATEADYLNPASELMSEAPRPGAQRALPSGRRPRLRAPYADHLGDGIVQLSFTLPVPYGLAARKAALELAAKMGFEQPEVVHYQELTDGYTYFVMYGELRAERSTTRRCSGEGFDIEYMSEDEIERFAARAHRPADRRRRREHRHGHAQRGHRRDAQPQGLPRPPRPRGLSARSRRTTSAARCPTACSLAKAIELDADAILVSQTVTQQNLHIHNLTELVEIVEAEGRRRQLILACGGPRVSNELAKELGYDAGFSQGHLPAPLASFIVRELAARMADRRPAIARGQLYGTLATSGRASRPTACCPAPGARGAGQEHGQDGHAAAILAEHAARRPSGSASPRSGATARSTT